MRREIPVDTIELAKALLGAVLTHETGDGRAAVRIVETEAYLPGDAASHAFSGRPTPRTRSMYLRPGHAYVYRAYGVSWMLNVSSEAEGVGAGVLIRAGEPLEGLETMKLRRGADKIADLARGPGRLCQALGVDLTRDGLDLFAGEALRIEFGRRPETILATARIGITREVDRPLRFIEAGSPFVSGPRRLNLAGAHV